jgi:protein-L-isoaspartate(D-aspartate) O-methyltransferase
MLLTTVKRDENMTLVSEAIRKAMVKRVQQQGVQDPLVLAAMEAVPRHYF